MHESLSHALDIAVLTDPGLVRRQNEDAVFANPNLGVAILADGMGGHCAGEVASRLAIMQISAELESRLAPKATGMFGGTAGDTALRDAVQAGNAAIYQAATSQPSLFGMGTTLVAAVFCNNKVAIAHVGDSRAYRLRVGELSALTHDHSLVQAQLDRGEITPDEALVSENKSLLTRALGVAERVDVDIHEFTVLPGDLYLLCSDGLHDGLRDEEIKHALLVRTDDLDALAARLVQIANARGGHDNVSVILVRVLREFPAATTWWSGLMARF